MKNKVLFTASTYFHILNFHLPYLHRFREKGWEVHVACGGARMDIPWADRVIHLPLEKRMTAPGNFQAAAQLRRVIREEDYRLVITHTSLAAFFTRMALWGAGERPKVVNMVHGYLYDQDTGAAKRTVLRLAEKLTAGQTDLVLTMNQWDLEEARRKRLGRRVAMVPGIGVDFGGREWGGEEDRRQLRDRLAIGQDRFVLLYAAEFSRRKSQSVLIQAMTKLPEQVVLVLPGSGDTLGECRELAQSLGVSERVVFPGYIEDMARWYAVADVAVSASRSEGLPFNIMEAMYAGVPVVASDVKGHRDLLLDGEAGLLYPYGDAAACAKQVVRLMEGERLRRKLANKARQNVLQYDLQAVLPVVMGQYEKLAPRQTAGTAR